MNVPRRHSPASFRRRTHTFPAVVLMCAALTGLGVAQAVLWALSGEGHVTELWTWLTINPARLDEGQYWRPFTFWAVHASTWHLCANLAVLFLAGREIEPILGRRVFTGMIGSALMFGGLASWAAADGPSHFTTIEVGGFSAAVAAVLAAYSTIMPELEQRVNVFFILPLRFRAKFYSLVIVALAGLCLYTGALVEVGAAGILAGSIVGWAWVKFLGFGNPLWIQRLIYNRRQNDTRVELMGAEEFIATEVDPILEKIAREGVQRLTRAEWKLLRLGSEKLARKAESSDD